MKTNRQDGQGAEDEVAIRDLKKELEERERLHYEKANLENKRKGILPAISAPNADGDDTKRIETATTADGSLIDLGQFDDADDSEEERYASPYFVFPVLLYFFISLFINFSHLFLLTAACKC